MSDTEDENKGADGSKIGPPVVEKDTTTDPTESIPFTETGKKVAASAHVPGQHQSSTRLAVAGLLLTLMGALVGGCSSFWATNATIRAQQEQSINAFRREERQEIYSKVLTQATRLENASRKARGKILVFLGDPRLTDDGQPSSIEITAIMELTDPVEEEWQLAYNELDAAISDAELVSSRRILQLACAIRDGYRADFFRSLQRFADRHVGPDILQPNSIDSPSTRVDVDTALSELPIGELREKYVAAAKEDLALND